jgi:cytochrome P450 family 9
MYGVFKQYAIVLTDPKLIKQVTIKDFDHFVNRDRMENATEIDKYLGRSVLMLRDQKWRDMRSMLSPIYTSSKMKQMFELLVESSEEFIDFFAKKAAENDGQIEIDAHKVFAQIAADGIATTALGFKGDCVLNENSKMFEIVNDMDEDFTRPKHGIIFAMFPKLWKLFGKQLFRRSIHEFFERNVIGEMHRRVKENVVKPDVLQLLLEVRARGKIPSDSKSLDLTDEDLIAQALVLFLGGSGTTANVLQAIVFELAMNLEVQQILTAEVDEMLAILDGQKISINELNQMKFLDMVMNEGLRKWPSFRSTARYCSKDYSLTDEETRRTFKIKKGTAIIIPIHSIQNDAKNFAEPEKYEPHRFSDDNKGNIQNGTFFPFGIGPRICIGSRYALMEMKLALFYIMSKFFIEKFEKTPEKLTKGDGNSGFASNVHVYFRLRK